MYAQLAAEIAYPIMSSNDEAPRSGKLGISRSVLSSLSAAMSSPTRFMMNHVTRTVITVWLQRFTHVFSESS